MLTAREKGIIATRKWQKANPEKMRVLRRTALDKKRTFLREAKEGKSCLHCGNDDIRVLQWAHKKQRDKSVRSKISILTSWVSILAEIKKCIILCANCHAIFDWNDRQKQDKAKRRS